MSSFDVAVGLDQTTMNSASAAVYQRVYPSLFKGSQQVTQHGIDLTVSWDVQSAPVFDLTPVNGQASTFSLTMSDVAMTVAGGGTSGTDQVVLTITVEASSANGQLSLVPLGATGTTNNPSDQWALNQIILPQAMTLATTLLAGVTLPPLQFSGITLTAPSMTVQQNHVIALANLAGGSVPTPPDDFTWPDSAFFGLLSDAARLAVATANTQGFNQTFGHKGTAGTSLGGASYGATATVSDLKVGLSSDSETSFTYGANVSGNVHADIEVLFVKIGVDYDLFAKPNPSGTLEMNVSGQSVVALINDVSTFVIVIEPSGSVVEKILSAITDPILQAVSAVFTPAISSALGGFSVPVWDIPSFPIQIPIGNTTVSFTVQPDDLTSGSFSGMMLISGSATVSGG